MSDSDKIKKILVNHEKRISDLEKLFKSKSIPATIGEDKAITNLITSGFFDNHKKYSEIIKKLKTQAQIDKKIKYAGILKKLTKESKLERKMVEHQWVYVKNE